MRPEPAARIEPIRFNPLTGYFSFVLIGWNGVLLPSLIRSIERNFGASDAAFGLLYFVAALSYALGALGGGFITERIGRKLVLFFGALLPMIGLAAQAISPLWALFIVFVLPVSWGSAIIDAGVNALFLDVFRDARGGALSLLHTFYSVGALIAPVAIGALITVGVDWRIVIAATGLGYLSLAMVLRTADMPSGRWQAPAAADSGQTIAATEWSLLPFIGLALGIGFYVATELGVSAWVVRFLANLPVAQATGVLSLYWGGLAVGRFLSNRIVERIDYTVFTVACLLLASLSLAGAALLPWAVVVAALFGLSGLFSGPVYPMIMALGGNIYPNRLAALTGGLTTAAVTGSIIYPPLMGVMASSIGLRGGLVGAALLGVPASIAVVFASRASRRA